MAGKSEQNPIESPDDFAILDNIRSTESTHVHMITGNVLSNFDTKIIQTRSCIVNNLIRLVF
jgi:hypothetical protein